MPKPENVTPGSHDRFCFTYKNGHSCQRRVYQITNNGGACKMCAG